MSIKNSFNYMKKCKLSWMYTITLLKHKYGSLCDYWERKNTWSNWLWNVSKDMAICLDLLWSHLSKEKCVHGWHVKSYGAFEYEMCQKIWPNLLWIHLREKKQTCGWHVKSYGAFNFAMSQKIWPNGQIFHGKKCFLCLLWI